MYMKYSIYQYVRIFLTLILAVGFTGCIPTEEDKIKATENAKTVELTGMHGDEVKRLILEYHTAIDTIEFQTDLNVRAQFLIGPALDYQPQNLGLSPYTKRYIDLSEIHVLEYTPQKIKAVGCGVFAFNFTDETGQVKELPPISFMNIYIFMSEGNRWKKFTGYTFRDPKSDLRDWAYVSEEEKREIGDLQMYIDRFFPCG